MPVRPSVVSAVLFLSVLGVSFSGPLVRLSDAHAIAIAAWRLAFALVVLVPALLVTGGLPQLRRLRRKGLLLSVAGGVLLALHFWSWNSSIELTTIAASVVLVNVQPLIVAALSAVWLRERPTRRQFAGIVIAVVGAAVVVAPDFLLHASAFSRRAALGDALALAGAVTAAGYYVIGRRLRATLDLLPYVVLVYGICLATLLAIALATNVSLGPFPPREYAIFAGLAVGPMLLGHTGMNWALGHARAYQVNVALLGEPVLATLLAAVIPGIDETPGIATLIGGAIVLAGIVLAESRSRPSTPADVDYVSQVQRRG